MKKSLIRRYFWGVSITLTLTALISCSANEKAQGGDAAIAIMPFFDATSYDPHDIRIVVYPNITYGRTKEAGAFRVDAKIADKSIAISAIPTGKKEGEYMLDLSDDVGATTDLELTITAGEHYSIVAPNEETIKSRTIKLNHGNDVKVVQIGVCKKDYVSVDLVFSENIKGAAAAILHVNTTKGIIEGRLYAPPAKDGVTYIGPTVETTANSMSYRLDSDASYKDILSFTLDREVYSPAKKKNITIKSASTIDGQWHTIAEDCAMWW